MALISSNRARSAAAMWSSIPRCLTMASTAVCSSRTRCSSLVMRSSSLNVITSFASRLWHRHESIVDRRSSRARNDRDGEYNDFVTVETVAVWARRWRALLTSRAKHGPTPLPTQSRCRFRRFWRLEGRACLRPRVDGDDRVDSRDRLRIPLLAMAKAVGERRLGPSGGGQVSAVDERATASAANDRSCGVGGGRPQPGRGGHGCPVRRCRVPPVVDFIRSSAGPRPLAQTPAVRGRCGAGGLRVACESQPSSDSGRR